MAVRHSRGALPSVWSASLVLLPASFTRNGVARAEQQSGIHSITAAHTSLTTKAAGVLSSNNAFVPAASQDLSGTCVSSSDDAFQGSPPELRCILLSALNFGPTPLLSGEPGRNSAENEEMDIHALPIVGSCAVGLTMKGNIGQESVKAREI